MALEFVEDKLKSDMDIVKAAFEQDKNSLKFASRQVQIKFIEENPMYLEFASSQVKSDIDVVRTAFNKDKHSL